jgi:DNA-binding transcriptional regulator YdaS (Cro superfamily)
MEPKEITRELKKVGGVKSVAENLNIKPPTVSQVIHRVRSTEKIREAIASAIKRPVNEVFPPTPKEPA